MKERDNPWFKFFPRDWLEGTRHLSIEERGAYIDAIAMRMISDGPLPCDDYKWLAHQMHVSPRKARSLVEALVEAKRLLKTDAGITDERCEDEIAKRAHQRKINAENAAKRTDERDENSANAADKSDENSKNANDNNDGSSVSLRERRRTRAHQEPDPEIEKKENPPKPPVPGGGIIDQFEEWWAAYPPSVRKVAKGECLALFRQAVTGQRRPGKSGRSQKVLDHGLVAAEQLIAAVKRYAATKPDPEYVPAPATWLNQGRWLDDQGASAPAGLWWEDPAKRAAMTPERWRKGITEFANGKWPVDKLGYPPGDPDCIVPKAIIDELRLTERYTPDGISRIPH